MTLTDHDVRAALDLRIRTAGLDDDAALPPPRRADLRLESATAPRPHRPAGRLLAVAAVLVLLGGLAVLVARGPIDDGSRAGTGPADAPTTAAPTTTRAVGRRDALPPPWPMLDVQPAAELDLGGDPIDSEEEFAERLPELDQQSRTDTGSGRTNVLDQLTGEVVSVNRAAYDAQFAEVTDWYRTHLGGIDGVLLADLDPAIVFTNGSYRIVHRSTLDCSPLPDGRTRPACVDLGN